MSVIHIVAFNVPADKVKSLTAGFTDLHQECKKDNKTYIKSVRGGAQMSTENFHHDTKVVFIMEFESTADLAYYLDDDEAHNAFKTRVRGEWSVQGVVALDFVDGQY